MLLTLAACGGSPSADETGSGDTTVGAQTEAATTAPSTTTSTTTPTTGATGDATSGSTEAPTTGSTEAPTTGGPDGAMFCEERCMVDADCAFEGENSGTTCKDNRCVEDPCVGGNDCLFVGGIARNKKCAAQADCEFSVCVDAGDGVGRCASTPDEVPCDILDGEAKEAMYPPIEGGAPVTVCTFPEYMCTQGACFNPCETDDDCFFKHEPTCDVSTGLCRCNSDAECQSIPEFQMPVCYSGKCGCGSDVDCEGRDNVDRCYEGVCGCSSKAACTTEPLYDGTMYVCE
ncbi:MAG: hypothetical protein JNL82_16325 [Myxococcales bacterium]|nr:hypothetical protein [Myxococcales bacterium]